MIPVNLTGYIVMPDVSLSRVAAAAGMEGPIKHNAYAALKGHRKRIADLDKQLERDNARMEEVLALLSDPNFYTQEEGTSDVIAEHASLKQRIEKAEEEWRLLNEELEEEMARQQAGS